MDVHRRVAYVARKTGLSPDKVVDNLSIDFTEGVKRFAPEVYGSLPVGGDTRSKVYLSVAERGFFRDGSSGVGHMQSEEARQWYDCHAAAGKFKHLEFQESQRTHSTNLGSGFSWIRFPRKLRMA